MALDGNDAVSDLGQSLNIDVGAAIDLPDCGSGALPVDDEYFIFSRCALREEDSRERQDKSQRQEESKIAMFVHHARFTNISALTSEATNIIRRVRGTEHAQHPKSIRSIFRRDTSAAICPGACRGIRP